LTFLDQQDRWIDISVVSQIKPGGGEMDDNANVILVGATYQEPWSIIRFRRNIDTGDSQDVIIRVKLLCLFKSTERNIRF